MIRARLRVHYMRAAALLASLSLYLSLYLSLSTLVRAFSLRWSVPRTPTVVRVLTGVGRPCSSAASSTRSSHPRRLSLPCSADLLASFTHVQL
ncbi:hypothetical protein LZ30DRAFT_719906 [Colletotrichum cereale]|nr:hypothetical protein LZ30DRAFT_719906 [Colletotrichum cereale]